MRVTFFSCGPAANESELIAFKHLQSRLTSLQGDDEWLLLSNFAFSVTHQLLSDEIDVLAIGPTGVRVVEVTHRRWSDERQFRYEETATLSSQSKRNKAVRS